MMHPVHVSITNMDYKPDQNKITLSFKVFRNDFQLLFVHLYQLNIDFDDEENYQKYEGKINDYFTSHFKIMDNKDKPYYISYQGMKKDEDSMWFYYDVPINKKKDSFTIINTILFDLYFDQKNMFIFNYNNKEKGYMFNLKQSKQIIDFNDF